MAFLPLRPIGRPLADALDAATTRARAERAGVRDGALAEKQAAVRAGWGEPAVARVREKGKLPTWERIALLQDPGTEVHPIGSYVNWGRDFKGSKQRAPGAGVVTAFVTVAGRQTVVIANDNTVASGSWWPRSEE